jgi:hypothetical protein
VGCKRPEKSSNHNLGTSAGKSARDTQEQQSGGIEAIIEKDLSCLKSV